MTVDDLDSRLRATVFAYLDGLTERSGLRVVATSDLLNFEFEGRRAPLVQQRGIVKFSWLEAAVSIRTAYRADPTKRPYDDHDGADNYPRYKWQGDDPTDYDNQALLRAMADRKPLVWFTGTEKGWYLPVYPTWVVAEEPALHQVVLAPDATMRDNWLASPDLLDHSADAALRREYATSLVQRRVHQRVFRERVLAAYERRCALCNLRHVELLDAAHIKEDADGGEPVVPNGVAMCVLHHRAFDNNVIGIRRDYVVETNKATLLETDGPTLQHALQGVHGQTLLLPELQSARPDRSLLEERYERFLSAS